MSDFFDIDELRDDNGKQCALLDTGERRYIMDDQNKFDIQLAFVDARTRACREYKTEIDPLAWMGALKSQKGSPAANVGGHTDCTDYTDFGGRGSLIPLVY